MRYHFISSIVTIIVFTLAVTLQSFEIRVILLIPSLILFYLTLFLFAVDYDQLSMKEWEKKEKKVYEEAYLDFVEEYYKKSKNKRKKHKSQQN
ncbi:MAG: hypothetical protein ACOCZ6_03565 [Nanoarchaeota archaeon]